jgi:hypothetical protein
VAVTFFPSFPFLSFFLPLLTNVYTIQYIYVYHSTKYLHLHPNLSMITVYPAPRLPLPFCFTRYLHQPNPIQSHGPGPTPTDPPFQSEPPNLESNTTVYGSPHPCLPCRSARNGNTALYCSRIDKIDGQISGPAYLIVGLRVAAAEIPKGKGRDTCTGISGCVCGIID